MPSSKFRSMIVEETSQRRFVRRITRKAFSDLPEGDILIKVHYSMTWMRISTAFWEAGLQEDELLI